MRFEFATARRVLFGPGTLGEIGPIAREMGTRALVVTGRTISRSEPLREALATEGISATTYAVAHEPTAEDVRLGLQRAQEEKCDLVVGFGGGSALDAAKAIAALLTNGGDPLDYMEVIGRGKSLGAPPVACILIPTTAGTGAEVTRNAVLMSPEHRVKVSMRSPMMLPRVALIDPELTHSTPPEVTAATGLDALTQVLEPYVSSRRNPLVDGICREGMRLAGLSLKRAHEQGDDGVARERMALVSLFGGMALANAGLGAVHGLAGVIGGMFGAPHGGVCARLLPHVTAMNLRALQERMPGSPVLRRYEEVAQVLTGNPGATARDGLAWLEEVCDALAVAPLSSYGITAADFPAVIEKAAASSSMKGNPVSLAEDEIREILEKAL